MLSFSRPPVAVGLALAVGAEAVLVGANHLSSGHGLVVALVAIGTWGIVASDARLESQPRWVVAALLVVFACALAFPPRGSHDLWSYVMYGRTAAVHHASPYVHAPRDYPHDPFLHLVAPGWRGTTSVYGPLFTGVSVVLAKFAGASVLRARLAFQGLALLGVVAVLAMLWIETRSVRALAYFGLHPVVVTAIVNGGHNDGWVGLAVLWGAVLVTRRRVGTAGVVVGLGMLVKATTAFGLLGLSVWLFSRRRRDGFRFVAIALSTTAAGYALVGMAALSNLAGAAGRTSRDSVWSPISRVVPGATGAAAFMVVIVLAVVAARRFRSHAQPSIAAAAAIAAYLFAGAYVLPWYPAWALPSVALARRSWVATLVAVHAAFLVATYELSRTVRPGSFVAVVRGAVMIAVAVAVVVVFVAGIVRPAVEDTDKRVDVAA